MSGSNSNIIRSYLVAIGYKVDGASEDKFTRSLTAAALQAKLLGDAIEGAARAVHDAVAAMARDLEQMYFASQRTKASVENIKALGFALSNVGGSAEGALGTLESIARFMRNNPAGESFIRGLGVQTRSANGQLRDTGEIVTDLQKRLGEMPSYLRAAYGNVFGIDERTLMADPKELARFQALYKSFVAAVGLDQKKAAEDGHAFMVASRTASAATSVLFEKVAAQLAGPLAHDFDRFTSYLVAHYQQISRGLEVAGRVIIWFMATVTTGVTRAAEAIGELSTWFDSLDVRSQHLIEAAAGLLVAWRLLSKGFLATPLGALIAGLTGLLLLLEDYAGWRSGKRSLIDWSSMDGPIQSALKGFTTVATAINSLVEGTVGWEHALEGIAVLMAGSWVRRVVGAFGAARAAQAAAAGAGGAGAGLLGGLGLMLRRYGPLALLGLTGAAGGEDPEFSKRKNDEYLRSHGMAPGAGGESGGASPAPTGPMSGTAQHIMQVMMGLGWNRNQAAGLAARVQLESGGRADKPGDSGLAYGALQWHPNRQANFAKWAGHDIHSAGLDEQLRFMDFELRRGTEQAAGRALMLAQGARDAGAIVSSRFARPRDREGNILATGSLAEQFAGAPLMSPGVAAASNSTTNTNSPTVNSTTTINVSGSDDPHATAKAIGAHQDRVAQNAARNLRGAVS